MIVACVAATIAFGAYTRTLLPGVDLGDTGGFQAAATTPDISARQAYPLYYALARPFVRLTAPQHPALALNLFSAGAAAIAVFLLTLVAALVTRSSTAGLVAGLLFAFSYTWWHQAIIAEVYTLHLALVGLCLVALLSVAARPSRGRLALFFAVYALAFGNHFSTILLFVPFAIVLLLVSHPPSLMFRPSVVALAVSLAACGTLQYLPNLLALKNAVGAPEGLVDTAAAFWFDVTKSDWRQSMLLGVEDRQLQDHLAMALFDARQQFGVAGLLLALVGSVRLWRRSRPWAVLALTAYALNTAFALTYNVGDPHVFFLPGHYFTAFLAAAAVMPTSAPASRGRVGVSVMAIAAVVYAVWRGYDTWPAADRHQDHRAERLVDRLTFGLDEREAVLAVDLDWQLENALLYAGRVDHREVAWVRLQDVLLHFPFFVDDNHRAGRDVVLTERAGAQVEASFGSFFTLAPDPMASASAVSLQMAAAQIPRGAPYVLAILAAPRGEAIDEGMLSDVLNELTGGAARERQSRAYEVFAGLCGHVPSFHHASAHPFRTRWRIAASAIDIRMDGWLPAETFRRGGFGHVIRNHEHMATLERGVNLIWFDEDGRVSPTLYAASLYAPQARFRIPASADRLARLHKPL